MESENGKPFATSFYDASVFSTGENLGKELIMVPDREL